MQLLNAICAGLVRSEIFGSRSTERPAEGAIWFHYEIETTRTMNTHRSLIQARREMEHLRYLFPFEYLFIAALVFDGPSFKIFRTIFICDSYDDIQRETKTKDGNLNSPGAPLATSFASKALFLPNHIHDHLCVFPPRVSSGMNP